MQIFRGLIYASLVLAVPAFGAELHRTIKPRDQAKIKRLTACSEIGPDYFRVGDSTMCLKISGYVQADYVYRGSVKSR